MKLRTSWLNQERDIVEDCCCVYRWINNLMPKITRHYARQSFISTRDCKILKESIAMCRVNFVSLSRQQEGRVCFKALTRYAIAPHLRLWQTSCLRSGDLLPKYLSLSITDSDCMSEFQLCSCNLYAPTARWHLSPCYKLLCSIGTYYLKVRFL